jgi:hypothetical protein
VPGRAGSSDMGASLSMVALPHRSYSIRRNHDGKALKGWQGLLGGRQRIVAVSVPVTLWGHPHRPSAMAMAATKAISAEASSP